ncbi:polyprenyl synthetase family protein [candidate division WWE3 bacterium]|jgi:geranylgeranyl diphosphate synthase, type II|nr:polyprenyl synthetase family protein [candidate division WWE3 bacterium]
MIDDKNDVLKILGGYKLKVWKEIEPYLIDPKYHELFEVPVDFDNDVKKVWQVVKEYPERQGKYLRPSLLMLTLEACGGESERGLKTAAAVQISEEWILIHDDIEDDSIKRRGAECLHRKYGLGEALNAGDMLHLIMWRVLLENKEVLGEALSFDIMRELNTILMRTALGQGVEMDWASSLKLEISEDGWLFVADGKTAYYSIVAPLRLGAMIAEASENELDKLTEFGLYLGRCFQLVDDLLDVTGDFGGLKVKGDDIREGKQTLILGHLLGKIKGVDKARLIKILSKNRKDKTLAEVVWVMNKMDEMGSITYARNKAKEYKEKALEYFKKNLGFLKNEPARGNLLKLVNFVLERDH